MPLIRMTVLGAIAVALAAPAFAQNIVLGVSTPITGPAATAAEWEKWGYELAVAEINSAGGVLGRKLELVVHDNRCNPSESVNVANKLIETKVAAIIGAHCSSASLAAMPLIKDAKIPMVGGVASSPKITELSGAGGNEWTFRINPSDQDMMDALGLYLGRTKRFKNVAVVAEDTDFGRGGVNAFVPVAEKAGVKIISTDYHPQNQPDFVSILTRLQQQRPDAIALFQLGGDQINFLRQAMQVGVRLPYTGRAELGGRNLQVIEAGGMEGSISAWSYSHEVDSPENTNFIARIQERHKSTPYLQTWSGYDSVRIIAQAIREANSAEPAKIRDALQNITFTNVLGKKVKFDKNNQAGKIVVLQEVKGKKVTVAELIELK